MIRGQSFIFWVLLTLVTSLGLYDISNKTHALGEKLRQVNAAIEEEQTRIHVLNAEYAYLSNPARIRQLAGRHLALQPTAIKQVAAMNDLKEILPTRSEEIASVIVDHAPMANFASLPARPAKAFNQDVAEARHVNTRMKIEVASTSGGGRDPYLLALPGQHR